MNYTKLAGYLTAVGAASSLLTAQGNGIVDGNATATITIDDQPLNVVVEPRNGGFQIPKGTVVGTEEGQIEFTEGVQLNPDPSIGYGFAVIDFGAPSIFAFDFATPIVPTGPVTTVFSTLAAGLTDFTDNGFVLHPVGGGDVQTSAVDGINMGVDLGPAFARPPGGTGVPVGLVYGPFAEGPIAGPAGGPFTSLSVHVGFGLNGGGDIAALTGSATIIEGPPVPDVPEGGAGIAGVAAIGALLLAARRMRS